MVSIYEYLDQYERLLWTKNQKETLQIIGKFCDWLPLHIYLIMFFKVEYIDQDAT